MIEKLNKALQNNTVMKVLSLIIAIIAYFLITQSGTPWWQELFSDSITINNVVVTTNYDKDKYYVSGIPNQIPIELTGSENSLIKAQNQKDSMHVYIDLSNYNPGKYEIESKDMKFDVPQGVEAKSQISKFDISIQTKETRSYPISLTYNDANLDGSFIFEENSLSSNTVNITGGSETLSQIASVQAIVDLSSLDTAKNEGTLTVKAPLKVYNDKGESIDNIELSKSEISVELSYKSEAVEVPISYQFSGQGNNYVSEICPVGSDSCNNYQNNTVKVFGERDKVKELANKGGITYNIDLSNLNQEAGEVEGVALVPSGVYLEGGNARRFNVKTGPGVTKTLNNVQIQTRGLDSKYSIEAVGNGRGEISVDVTGSSNIINGNNLEGEEKLEPISASDIVAYIDLSHITKPGTYEVPINIITNKPINYTLSEQVIKIEVV